MKKRFLLNMLRILLSVILLGGLVAYLGIQSLISSLKEFHISTLSIVLLLYLLTFLVLITIMFVMVRTLQPRVKYQDIIPSCLLNWSLGFFFPAKLGDFSYIYLVKKHGLSLGQGSALFFMDRFISTIVLFTFASFGFIIFLPRNIALGLIAAFIILILGFIFFAFSSRGRSIIKLLSFKLLTTHLQTFSSTIDFLLTEKKSILIDVLMTIINRFLQAFIVLLLYRDLDQHIPFFTILIVLSMITLLSLIPFTLAGLGIRELGAVLLFSQLGIKEPITLAVFTIVLLFNYALAGSILALFWKNLIKKTSSGDE